MRAETCTHAHTRTLLAPTQIPVDMKVLEDLNMAIRYEAFFNLVLGFYLLLMFAFLVIHVFPNLFPAGE